MREPARVRAAYVTDPDIAAMVVQYAAPRPGLDGKALFEAAEGDVDGEVVQLPTVRDGRSKDDGKRRAS